MNHRENFSTCGRTDDLVSVLYGEASERERREFELHLKECGNCRAQFAAFAQVRESIGEWRDQALTGFLASQAAPAPVRKSAIAALRQFFDLSPLWMKSAVGFAAVIFCVLAIMAVMRLQPVEEISPVATVNPGAVYTEQDLERAVQEALAKQPRPEVVIAVERRSNPNRPNITKTESKTRRPFSKTEREQLAAELRLLANQDELDLDLLGDQINR